jgi:hypothetical protein
MYRRTRDDDTYFSRTKDVISKKPDLVRPPFMHTWLEMLWPDEKTGYTKTIGLDLIDMRAKAKLLHEHFEHLHAEILSHPQWAVIEDGQQQLEHYMRGLAIAQYYERNEDGLNPHPLKTRPISMVIRADGGHFYDWEGADQAEEYNEKIPDYVAAAGDIAVTTLLMLKSRNSLLTIAEPEISPFQKRRMGEAIRSGKPINQPFHVIKFDLAREFRRNPDQTEEQARATVAEHIVMGHFKLRDSGLYWWSPHWRGGTEEDKVARYGTPAIATRRTDGVLTMPSKLIVPGFEKLQ